MRIAKVGWRMSTAGEVNVDLKEVKVAGGRLEVVGGVGGRLDSRSCFLSGVRECLVREGGISYSLLDELRRIRVRTLNKTCFSFVSHPNCLE